jgi:hypothetical protein
VAFIAIRDRVSLQCENKHTYLSDTPASLSKTSDEYYLGLKNKTAIPMPKQEL